MFVLFLFSSFFKFKINFSFCERESKREEKEKNSTKYWKKTTIHVTCADMFGIASRRICDTKNHKLKSQTNGKKREEEEEEENRLSTIFF